MKPIYLVICVPLPGKDSHFFRLQVCLNPFFLSRSSCLSAELLMLWEIFSLRDCKFSFSVSHSWSNHFICDLHLILLPLAYHPASLHASIKVALSNSAAVSMLWCLTAATNLDWTVCINSDMSTPTGSARNTCRVLSVILLLPKIFLTTLDTFYFVDCLFLGLRIICGKMKILLREESVLRHKKRNCFPSYQDYYLNSRLMSKLCIHHSTKYRSRERKQKPLLQWLQGSFRWRRPLS